MSDGCSVLGCGNTFKKGGKNFYRFPRTAHLQQKWISFTRQKDLDPKEAFICQDHFDQESLEKRHGIIRLGKNAIPTIGFADQPEEEEDFIPDPEVQEVTNEDQEFLDEESAEEHPVKSCCRFCGETKELNYPTKELESLGIDVDNLFKFLDLNSDYNSYLSEIICEDCFLVVSPLGAFKQRCKEAEVKMLLDLGFIEEQQIQETVENTSEICEEYLDGEDSTEQQQETEIITGEQEVELEKTSQEPDTSEPEPKKARVQKITKRSLLYECTLCKAYFTDIYEYKRHVCIPLSSATETDKFKNLKCVERVETEIISKQPSRNLTIKRKQQ